MIYDKCTLVKFHVNFHFLWLGAACVHHVSVYARGWTASGWRASANSRCCSSSATSTAATDISWQGTFEWLEEMLASAGIIDAPRISDIRQPMVLRDQNNQSIA